MLWLNFEQFVCKRILRIVDKNYSHPKKPGEEPKVVAVRDKGEGQRSWKVWPGMVLPGNRKTKSKKRKKRERKREREVK